MTPLAHQNSTRASITFTLDGKQVTASPTESIWQVAKRHGIEIPHLCYREHADYRADGNCRACMVEIAGERVLGASCVRKPTEGMEVSTATASVRQAREGVLKLLLSDQAPRAQTYDPDASFWQWADKMGVLAQPHQGRAFPASAPELPSDRSHHAISVNLDACIACNLCVRACREVQGNDVIGMAHRGDHAKIVFDFDADLGDSTCVACGECVQVCPTGALLPSSLVHADTGRLRPELHPASSVPALLYQQSTAQQSTAQQPKDVDTLCPFCGVGCQITARVLDNQITKIDGRDGPANHGRLCVKGRFGYDYTHSPERLTKPLIRRPDAAKSAQAGENAVAARDQFYEASWEEALEVAASGFRRLLDTGKSLAGFGSAKGSNEEAYLFQKFIRTIFATNNVDHCTRLCHASSVAALMEGIGSGAVTAPFWSAEDSDLIMVIGARPTDNHPVAATFFKSAAKRGADLIVCDPRTQGLTRFAKTHLAFAPGTDVALLNAMLATIIEEELYDRRFVDTRTEGFAELARHLKAFSAEQMAPHCQIDAATIRDVARRFARAKSAIIFWGMGVSQHVHGTDNARCLIALAAITGNIGKPGAGLHPLRGQNNVQGASDVGLIPMYYPDYQSVEDSTIRSRFESAWGQPLDSKRGLTVVEIIDAIYARAISGMYIMGENPAMSDPDTAHVREALSRLEHLVVQEIFFTETAAYADVILPATTLFEKEGTFTNTNRQIQLARQALAPPGDARQDWKIIVDLANRLGANWAYLSVAEIYHEYAPLMPSLKDITWEMITTQDSVVYPYNAANQSSEEIMFANRVPTASGMIKLVPTQLLPPAEVPDHDFPMVLTTGRLLEHWHTGAMTRRASVLDALEPRASAHLHPREMARRELSQGDLVTVETRRGALRLPVRSDPEVSENMVFIPFCYHEQPANRLTNPALDPFGKIPEFKFCAARITLAA